MIFKAICVLALLALGGCAVTTGAPYGDCSAPISYQCEIDMYMRSGA